MRYKLTYMTSLNTKRKIAPPKCAPFTMFVKCAQCSSSIRNNIGAVQLIKRLPFPCKAFDDQTIFALYGIVFTIPWFIGSPLIHR